MFECILSPKLDSIALLQKRREKEVGDFLPLCEVSDSMGLENVVGDGYPRERRAIFQSF